MEIWILGGLVFLAFCGIVSYLTLVAKDMKSNKDHVFMSDVIEGETNLDKDATTNMIGTADDTDQAADPGGDPTDN